ncbi:hypothetical protein Prudu_010396 [Prunus dulcis]|uniref:Uncharacterized protein n=1 Tax=Prunus dulcis TaxID=3755 RepID=A0A4Y1R8Z8_PRUDU|nr:hypothetical protein Prudu_010396 [Prunus dulcis]
MRLGGEVEQQQQGSRKKSSVDEEQFPIFAVIGQIIQMDEINHLGRHGDTSSAARPTTPRESRYAVDDAGDRIECSGKYCKSCSGALIADCVALCCCPCALLNLLTLAFVKVPWMVGRKCLGLGKSKGQKRKSKRKCSSIDDDDDHHQREVERKEEERMPEISSDQMECVSARLEAERRLIEEIWLPAAKRKLAVAYLFEGKR